MNLKNRFLAPFLLCLVLWLVARPAQGQGFSVGNYQVLSSTRVGRTEFEYVLRVTISNRVASALGVAAQVYSISANTTIIQPNVNFGDVALGSSAVSADTITIRQNRLASFNPADLAWFISVKSMPLSLTVIAPVSGFLTNGTNVVVTGTIGPAVDGVTIGRSTATLNGTNFSGAFPLEEGRNTISVLASNQYGGSGLINVFVTRDTTPPLLNIETPTNGTVLAKRQVTISGLVNDAVPGTVNPEQASVMVNGLSAMILNRSFSISDVLLVPGTNTITAVARDRAGNERQQQIQLVFIDPASQKHLVQLAGDAQTAIVSAMLPQPLLVELVTGDGVVQTNQPVTFAVTRNDGILFASPDSGRTLTVQTDDKGQAKVLLQLGTRTGAGNNQVVVTSPGVNGQLQFEANAVGAPPAKISPLIPETQVGEVAKPLPQPWTAYATDSGGNPVAGAPITFTVSQGGGSLGGATTVITNTDSDGRAFVTLTLGPDEGINNNVVIAGSPGVTNSSAVFTASGQTPGAVNATRVVGLVLDNANRPMSNILCVIANTTRATVTDQQGQFAISRVPVGAVRLLVDAQNRGYPGEWHSLQFNLVTVAGRDTSLDRPIYMVQVDTNSAAMAGGDQDVTLHLKDFPGAYLTVYAHSVRNDQGQPVTNRVTWTQVNNERIPMAPPQGSQPILTTAILPAGLRFNPPARMCIPNNGLPPGQILELYGFDHDIGSFVSVGTATVSSDGSLICSDPGFGVVKSGWHPYVPPPPPCTPVCSGKPPDTDCIKQETVPPKTKCDCPTYNPKETKIIKVDPKVEGTNAWVTCTNVDLHFTVEVTSTNCGGYTYEWDFKDGTAKDTTASPTHKFAATGDKAVEVTVKCSTCTSAEMKGTVNVGIAEITFARAGTEDAAGNAYGYEDLDTPADFSDDHVSVKNGGDTYVQVTIAGTTMFDKIFMVSKDEAKVKVDPATAAGASFKLKVSGQVNKGETQIEAHGGKKDGPTCASMNANSYKEIAVNGNIIRVFKTGAEAGTLGADVAIADVQSTANENLKYPVVKLTVGAKSKQGIAFDKNGNGKLDFYNDGNNPETKQIYDDLAAAGVHYTDSVLMKEGFPDVWRIASAVAVGATNITLTGGAGGLDTSETFSIGSPTGAGAETFRITSVAGQVLTIDTDPGTAGNQGFASAHPKGADDATSHAVKSDSHLVIGLSSNIGADRPALLVGSTAADVGELASHEQMHGQGLSDVNLVGNRMHYTYLPVDKKKPFRYKPLVQVITGTPNPKPGSPTDNQWEVPAR